MYAIRKLLREQGIYIDDPFAVVVDINLQGWIARVEAPNDTLPGLNVPVMKEFVGNHHRNEGRNNFV